MNYPNITTRIIYFGFYTSYYSLNINVSYHFQTLSSWFKDLLICNILICNFNGKYSIKIRFERVMRISDYRISIIESIFQAKRDFENI